ncbi:MAG: segregation/condensation protein A [Myxococcota bacterium]|nr:segregation/condensation protein A [Myxococcota bacterium]
MNLPDADMTSAPDAGDRPDLEGGEAGYAVKLPVFEGPLDLLLHLIRQNEVNIADIPIALIGRQYLDYIELMKDLNIDVAGEYLVMAATLALIKSRMLLPVEQEEEEGEALDPRAELVARLLEYQRFKEAADALARRRLLGRDIFEAKGQPLEPTPEGQREIEVGLFELIEAFRGMLDAAHEKNLIHSVETENVTVRDRMVYVMEQFEANDQIEFESIFQIQDLGPPSKPVLVATFLAILELARLGAVRIFQSVAEDEAPIGPIRLRCVPEEGDVPAWHERITETM